MKIIFTALGLFLIYSCAKSDTNIPSSEENKVNRMPKEQDLVDNSFKPASTNCYLDQLSDEYDFRVFVHYITEDSSAISVAVTDKQTNKLVDSVLVESGLLWSSMYANCKDVRSFSTGFNKDKKVADNYAGDFIIADFNFDGLEDFAVAVDCGGNGGTVYAFYLQNKRRKFVIDNFLSKEMERFPVSFDPKNKTLMTSVHANAYQNCESVFQLSAGNWKEISSKLVEL